MLTDKIFKDWLTEADKTSSFFLMARNSPGGGWGGGSDMSAFTPGDVDVGGMRAQGGGGVLPIFLHT